MPRTLVKTSIDNKLLKLILSIDIKRQKIDCLRFVMCPLLEAGFQGFFFLFFLMRPLTALKKQTRQAVCAIKQSIYLVVCGSL
jgi:hypothetical protein